MRNLLLFTFFLGFTSLTAQTVSPDYPTQAVYQDRYECQMTYYDHSFVSLRVQDFLSRRQLMGVDDTQMNLTDGVGTLTETYVDKIAINKDLKKVYVTYDVFTIGNDFVISSVNISGDPDAVLNFYIKFWRTDLNFDDVKEGESMSNRYAQDRISLSWNEGAPFVEVVNTTIDDRAVFIEEYLAKK